MVDAEPVNCPPWVAVLPDGITVGYRADALWIPHSFAHALARAGNAARAPDDPHRITQEDVDLAKGAAEEFASRPSCEPEKYLALAAKLSALLPPFDR